MKRFISFVFATFILTLVPLTVHANTTGEAIDQFTSHVVIAKDGSATINETIRYDFGGLQKHGIYRDIPVNYHDGSKTFYINASIKDVTLDGRTVDYKKMMSNGNEQLRIGDASSTVTGLHTYHITYTLSPVIYKKDGRLFLNLDVYGGGWQVPARDVVASVQLESGATLANVQWFGKNNDIIGTTPSLESSVVAAYQPLTINAYLPDGYTSNLLEPGKMRTSDILQIIIGILVALSVLVVVGGLGVATIMRQVKVRRRRKSQTVIPEYDPPEGMIPAEIGHLEDDTSDAKEFTATIIDWAIRGGLKIEQAEKSFMGIKRSEYSLIKGQPIANLTAGEQVLYESIFRGNDRVEVKKLRLPLEIQAFREYIKNRLTDKGYYQKDGNIIMRGALTDEGAKEWAKVDGFKLYLGVTEKDRLAFSDGPAKTPERFNKLLPYAVAYGVEKEWAKQFEGIDISSNVDWYTGNLAAFSAASLVSDINSGLSSAVASNASFSTGGGSAGGGVGGGGGGSW